MIKKLCFVSSTKHSIFAAVPTISSRSYSQDIKTIKNPDTAHLKRGTGGRSSFNGTVATVFGASGFLGRYICNQLGKRGTQIIVPHRSDPDDYEVKKLKLVGDLGQVLFHPFDLRDPLSIRKAIKYSNVVINLIGCDFETKNFNYNAVHVKGAQEIAKACREYNVERLIHFSALNLTDKPERYYLKKIQFLPSKLLGEQAVFEEFPNATVFRPAACYGLIDRFLWPLCNPLRSISLSAPLYAKGEKTIRQPVFAPDIALGVISAINDYGTRGKIYQAVGPERFYLKDIALYCYQILQRHAYTKRLIHDILIDPLFFTKIIMSRYILGFALFNPKFGLNFEQIERESVTDVVDPSLPTLADLGVNLSKMEDKIPHLIFKVFKAKSDLVSEYDQYYPADSLSAKALNEYTM